MRASLTSRIVRDLFSPMTNFSCTPTSGASGTTGIAWNPKFVQTPVTSLKELWNPAYKGRVGMMADIQDLGNFGLLKLGVDPETSTPADWRAAA